MSSSTCLEKSLEIVRRLDGGSARVCSLEKGQWVVHESAKQAILDVLKGLPCSSVAAQAYDKIASKFDGWSEYDFQEAGLRVAPTSFVRWGAFLERGVVLMPQSFINMGVFIDARTMIDSHVTVGSCCQIGQNCHIGAGAVLGGVLEPLSARPVIIEDDVFVGAHATLVEGVFIRRGAVIAAGVHLTTSTWIFDRHTGQRWKGEVPQNAVVIPGAYPAGFPGMSVQCAIVDHYKDAPVSVINEQLRSPLPSTRSEKSVSSYPIPEVTSPSPNMPSSDDHA